MITSPFPQATQIFNSASALALYQAVDSINSAASHGSIVPDRIHIAQTVITALFTVSVSHRFSIGDAASVDGVDVKPEYAGMVFFQAVVSLCVSVFVPYSVSLLLLGGFLAVNTLLLKRRHKYLLSQSARHEQLGAVAFWFRNNALTVLVISISFSLFRAGLIVEHVYISLACASLIVNAATDYCRFPRWYRRGVYSP